jgi:hypothetical protein
MSAQPQSRQDAACSERTFADLTTHQRSNFPPTSHSEHLSQIRPGDCSSAEVSEVGPSLLAAQFFVLGWSVLRLHLVASQGIDLDGGLALIVCLGVSVWIVVTLRYAGFGSGGGSNGRRQRRRPPEATALHSARRPAIARVAIHGANGLQSRVQLATE